MDDNVGTDYIHSQASDVGNLSTKPSLLASQTIKVTKGLLEYFKTF